MTAPFTLADLGWSSDFQSQLDPGERDSARPCRISAVHRSRVEAIGETGQLSLTLPRGLSTGAVAVGDWALAGEQRLVRLLERRTCLARRAAGTGVERQLIAANVDTLFIVTSCNADFNPARLERYIALAMGAGVEPVILLTKADLCQDPESWRKQAAAIDASVAVKTLDALSPDVGAALTQWCRAGRTVALAGSSGVGKTTLANMLVGVARSTAPIRENDAKGRHTTSGRNLLPMLGGGWLIDTPGMRELRLAEAEEGTAALFDDIDALALTCRFNDCSHQVEPGCAIRAAVATGQLDPERVLRWEKLKREGDHNSQALAGAHSRDRGFGRIARGAARHKAKLKRDP